MTSTRIGYTLTLCLLWCSVQNNCTADPEIAQIGTQSLSAADAKQLVSQHAEKRILEFTALAEITPDAAEVLAITAGEKRQIRLPALKTLDVGVASAFAGFRGALMLYVEKVPPDVAAALAKSEAFLGLDKLKELSSTELAEKIVADSKQWGVTMDELEVITPEVADVLARAERVDLKNIRCLFSPALAQKIVAPPSPPNTYRRDALLPRLESITPEVAAALARSGNQIHLAGIKEITAPTAAALAGNGNRLTLGLTELPDDVAAELGKHQGDLWLDHVSTLSPSACEGLSSHKVGLHLAGVRELSTEAIVALAKTTGDLDLGVVSLTDGAAHALASRKWKTMLFEVKTISDVAAEELLRASKDCSEGIKAAAAADIVPSLIKFPSQVTASAFSHTGDMFAVGCFDGSVCVVDAATKKKAFSIDVAGRPNFIAGLGFIANSNGIMAVSNGMFSGGAWIINVNNERVGKFLEGSAVHCMALDAKTERILLAIQGPQSCVVNLFALSATDSPLIKRTVERDTLRCIGFCSDESVAIGVGLRKAYMWHVGTRREDECVLMENQEITSACVSPKGRHLVVGANGGAVAVMPILANGAVDLQRKVEFKGLAGTVDAVAVSPDGTMVAAGDDRKRAIVWRIADQGVVTRSGKLTGGIRCLSFAPSGKAVAVGTGNFGDKQPDKTGDLYFLEF